MKLLRRLSIVVTSASMIAALLSIGLDNSIPATLAKSSKAQELQVGDKAPSFSLPDQSGSQVSLDDYLGKKAVVLYFYPQDDKLVCKKQACLFRDSYKEFVEAGAEVLGVSSNSIKSHKKFVESRHLPFRLLSDKSGEVRKTFGVPKSAGGLLPGRETFVIDSSGIIRLRFNSLLDAEKHVSEALRVLKSLDTKKSS